MGILDGQMALVTAGGPVAKTVSTIGPFCAKGAPFGLASSWRMS
jgi:hypothetical protein